MASHDLDIGVKFSLVEELAWHSWDEESIDYRAEGEGSVRARFGDDDTVEASESSEVQSAESSNISDVGRDERLSLSEDIVVGSYLLSISWDRWEAW